jgi:hypothetical protein
LLIAVPVLSLDITDISGEHQNDLTHDILKSRISKDGKKLEVLSGGGEKAAL